MVCLQLNSNYAGLTHRNNPAAWLTKPTTALSRELSTCCGSYTERRVRRKPAGTRLCAFYKLIPIEMGRFKKAFIACKMTVIKAHNKYDYRHDLLMSLICFLIGYFLMGNENILLDILGGILLLLGLIGSPLFFIIEGFWLFIIYSFAPKRQV